MTLKNGRRKRGKQHCLAVLFSSVKCSVRAGESYSFLSRFPRKDIPPGRSRELKPVLLSLSHTMKRKAPKRRETLDNPFLPALNTNGPTAGRKVGRKEPCLASPVPFSKLEKISVSLDLAFDLVFCSAVASSNCSES